MRRIIFVSVFSAGLVLGAPIVRADDGGPPETAERHGSAFIDPLGFLMFGPRLGVEVGGDHLAGALTGRWFDAALLSRSLFLQDGDNFGFSWGAGLRGRYYLDQGQSGAHVGAGLEYLRTRIETKAALVAAISSYVIPYAEGGYRLVRGRFYGDAAAALGYAARTGGHVENLPGGTGASTYEVQNKSSLYGAASLELGFFF